MGTMQMELVSNMTGVNVRNPAGENLGVVNDVLIELHPDLNAGTFAVVAFGGFNGVAQRLYAVPVELLVADPANQCFRLDASLDGIKAAPVFDADRYAVFSDDGNLNTVRDYYLRS